MFDLNSITDSEPTPQRILIYGEHGIGKTTFCSQFPDTIFIPTEDGLGKLKVKKFPLARCYQDVVDAIASLYSSEHPFKTVVIDSADWLEALIWDAVAKENKVSSVEKIGYQGGYKLAAEKMKEVLDGLTALRDQKNMSIVLTAHSKVKRYDDPRTDSYDRIILKLHERAAGLVSEWVDFMFYAAQETAVRKEDVGFGQKASRGITIGDRMLYCTRTAAFDAKNRMGFPEKIPMNYAAFKEELDRQLTT